MPLWKRAWGDDIQPITSPASLSQRSPVLPWKLIYEKNTIKQVCEGLPLGNFCVIALRRKKFTLSGDELTFSTWCMVLPACWNAVKNKSGLPSIYPLIVMLEQGGRQDDVVSLGNIAFILLRWWIRRRSHSVRNKNLQTREENQQLIIISKPQTEQGMQEAQRQLKDTCPPCKGLTEWNKSAPLKTHGSSHGQRSGECICSAWSFGSIFFQASQLWKSPDERESGVEWLLEAMTIPPLPEYAGDSRYWTLRPGHPTVLSNHGRAVT